MISATELMLIDENGEKKGIVSIEDALNAASKSKLDLVQVSSSDTNPVVCKLMDYGKHLFDQKKQKAASKKKTKKTQLKEIKFRPGTDENDYQIKLRNNLVLN